MTTESGDRKPWQRRMLFHGSRLMPLGLIVGMGIGFGFSDPWVGAAIGAGFAAVWTVIFTLQAR